MPFKCENETNGNKMDKSQKRSLWIERYLLNRIFVQLTTIDKAPVNDVVVTG